MKKDKIIQFAKQYGYDGVQYCGKWQGFGVYEPITNSDEPANIGKPEFILVSEDVIRMASEDEAFAYIDSLPDSEDYDEIQEV